ncbi:hypothetical protein [Nocardia brevicatena]|uniref:hypothetical protein n=1 Tax=Nocardia brevicatena TaxID=37327 RepID=UPI0012F884F3|nr:hypothetical protein [Nocardia brevicatena]
MATVLKMLLAEQHLKSHPDFLAAYDRCAAQLDPPIPPGHGPAKAQYYQWLSGRMIGIPRHYHCRVLEKMFPNWTVEELFQRVDSASVTARSHRVGLSGSNVRLEEFLGSEMVANGATLVYPTFELTGQSVDALRAAGIPRRHVFGKKDTAFTNRQHMDIPVILPENDIRGLLYVLSLLWRYTDIQTYVRSDCEAVAHSDLPYISFGLRGNNCIHQYVESAECPLFTIYESTAMDGTLLEHVQLTDGRHYDSSSSHSTGIIGRVRPSPNLHPDRYRIYCGGIGPRGTAGAGWYIAHYWGLLQQRVGGREFVAVVRVDENSEHTTTLERLLVGPTD